MGNGPYGEYSEVVDKKMSCIYLLNDVIQNTKKSHGDLFSKAFSKTIDRTFRTFVGPV